MDKLIAVAAGREKADLILKNLNIVNVLSGIIEKGDIAISGGMIAGTGEYNDGINVIDCNGAYAMPGFIDSHVHIESTHLSPAEFVKAVLPCGTTSVIADPHEIANVCGMKGIQYIYDESKKLPLDVYLMFPSCVPATPFETSGAILSSKDMEENLEGIFLGVGEFMNYPGVINADKEVLNKIKAAHKHGKIIDGHSAGVTGKDLNAYISAGIKTDHECISSEEMLEKINKGMYIQIREGSATKNLIDLSKGLNSYNMRRCIFCTDDKTPHDLLTLGHINNNIRIALKCGISLVQAVAMATINAAECYNLKEKGAIAPGYIADIVLTNDIENMTISQVYKAGKLVAENGKPLFGAEINTPESLLNTVNCPNITADMLQLKLQSEFVKVIKLIERNVVTEKAIRKVTLKDGCFAGGKDIVKIAVIERHKSSGNIGIGLLEGYKIKGGAVALTVAHDSHNIIVAGDNDQDMATAANALKNCGGGIAVVNNGKAEVLPLEIAGLLTQLSAAEFSVEYSRLCNIAYSMGVDKTIEPFMSLSFMSLSVIPHLKLTDKGLFDVDTFSFTLVEAEK